MEELEEEENLIIDFDGTWKAIIEEFFQDFIAYFLPKLFLEIDFSKPVEFLDQELQHIVETLGYKKRVTDKLVKVFLLSGQERWILIHIEIQSYFEKLFSKRMFLLYSWIYGKYDHDIAALAIYTSDKTPKEYNFFEKELFGTKVRLDFNAYKVMEQNEEDLVKEENIFSLFVLANKYVNETRPKSIISHREKLKEKICELAFDKKIDLEKTWRFVTFVDRIMLLPKEDMKLFNDFLKAKIKETMAKSETFSMKPTYEKFARLFYEATKGVELADVEKQAENERQNSILKLHILKKWAAEEVADTLGYDLDYVKKIILENAEKQI